MSLSQTLTAGKTANISSPFPLNCRRFEGDVLILELLSTGELIKSVSPSLWRSSDFITKYNSVEARGYHLDGYYLYRDCVVSLDIYEQATVHSVGSCIRVDTDSDHFRESLSNICGECDSNILMTLHTAAILKSLDTFVLHGPVSGAVCPRDFVRIVNGIRLGGIARAAANAVPPLIQRPVVDDVVYTTKLHNRDRYVACVCGICGSSFMASSLKTHICPDSCVDTFDPYSHKYRGDYWRDWCNCLASISLPYPDERATRFRDALGPSIEPCSYHSSGFTTPEIVVGPEKRNLQMQMFSTISRPSEAVVSTMERAHIALEELTPKTAEALQNVSSAAEGVSNLTARLSSAMDSTGSFLLDIFGVNAKYSIISFLSMLWDVHSGAYDVPDSSGPLRLMLRFGDVFRVDHNTIIGLVKKFKSAYNWLVLFVTKENSEVAQTELEMQADQPGFISLVAAFIGVATLGTLGSDKQLKKVSELCRTFNQGIPALKSIGDLICHLLDHLPLFIKSWFRVLSPSDEFYTRMVARGEFRKWYYEAMDVSNVKYAETIFFDFDLQERVLNVQKQGDEMLMECASVISGNQGSRMYSILLKAAEKLGAMRDLVLAIRGQAMERLTPFCLYIEGLPGVGKTTLAKYFISVLCPPLFPAWQRCYTRNATSKHWDGYRGQFCTLVDDFAQATDGSDCLEMISMISSATYPLPMASLTDPMIGKKGTCYHSPLAILCSNSAFPTGGGALLSTEALWRRRHVLLRVRPRAEVCIGHNTERRLDYSKFQQDFSHLEFDVVDPLSAHAPSVLETTNLEGALKYVRKAWGVHFERQKKVSQDYLHNTVVERVRAMIAGPGDCTFIPPTAKQIDALSILRDPTVVQPDKTEDFDMAAKELQLTMEGESSKHPRYSDAQKILAAVAVVAGPLTLFALYGAKKSGQSIFGGKLTPESMSERTKFRNAAAARRHFVAEGDAVLDRCLRTHGVSDRTRMLVDEFRYEIAEYAKKIGSNESPRAHEIRLFGGFMDRLCEMPLAFRLELRDLTTEIARVLAEDPEENRVFVAEGVDRITGIESSVSAPLVRERGCVLREKLLAFKDRVDDGAKPTVEERAELLRLIDVFVNTFTNTTKSFVQQHPELAQNFQLVRDTVESESKRVLRVEGSADENARTLVRDRVKPLMVVVTMAYSSGTRSMCGFMLKGSIGLFPRHLFKHGKSYAPEGTLVTIRFADGRIVESAFERKRCAVMFNADGTEKDAVLFDFGIRCSPVSDSTHLFISAEDLQYVSRMSGTLVTFDAEELYPTTQYISNIRMLATQRKLSTYHQIAVDVADREYYTVQTGWTYEAATSPGYCGSVLVASNPRLVRKFLGIHVCGEVGADYGESELITVEALRRGLALLSPTVCGSPAMPGLEGMENARLFPQGNFTYVGALPPQACPYQSEKTRIRPSVLFDQVVKHVTAPAVLSPKDPRLLEKRSLITCGVEKFGNPASPLVPSVLQRAVRFVTEEILAATNGVQRRILNESEAINGIPEMSFYDSLPMRTSPGYPYVLNKKLRGKKDLFAGEIGALAISSPVLRVALDRRTEKAKIGERVPSLWISALKDERRPLAKVAAGKTRTFMFAPTDLTILTRRYTLSFSAALFNSRLSCFFAPGINPFSPDWTRLAHKLTACSAQGFAGDYGNYDGTLLPEVIGAVCDIINTWYAGTEEDDMVRRTLFSEFVHTQVTCGNAVVYKHSGNPSGNPLTTIINSIVNRIYLAYAWLNLAPLEMRDLTCFRRSVVSFVFGDDNINAVAEEAGAFYNFVTVSQFFATLGLEYTHPDKISAYCEPLAPILSWTFLKCGFRESGRHYLPLLSRDSIHELTNWVTEDGDAYVMCNQNCEEALKYAFMHGPEYFEDLRRRILAAAQAIDFDIHLPEYEFYDAFFEKKATLPTLVYREGGGIVSVVEDDYLYPEERENLQMQSGRINTEPHQLEDAPMETMTTQKTVGVTQIQQSIPVMVEHSGASLSAPLAAASTQDLVWDYATLVKKEVLISTFNWTPAQTPRTNLFQVLTPTGLFSVSSVTHDAFQLFTFWRGQIVVKVMVNGNKFSRGRLIMYHVPLTNTAVVNAWHAKNTAAQTSVMHTMIDPCTNTIGMIKIPFISPMTFLNIRDLPSTTARSVLGTLMIDVLNQLDTGGSTSNLSVTVLVSFENAEFKLPTPLLITRRDLAYVIREKEELERRLRLCQKRIDDEEGGDDFEHLKLEMQGNTLTTNYNIKKSSGFALGNNSQTGDEIAHGASAGNQSAQLDKPNISLAPPPIVRVPLGYFSNGCNVEFNESMTITAGSSTVLATAETFGTTQDEMDIKYLCQIQNLDTTLTWLTIAGAGTVIYQLPITPCCFAVGPGTTKGKNIQVTTLDYVSAKFSYWNGDLAYRLQFIASQYHTGRLFISVMYGVVAGPSSLVDATSGYGAYIDLNGEQHDFEFIVPYVSNTPVTRVPNGNLQAGVVSNLDSIIGMLTIMVVNPLVAVNGASNSIDINLWRYAGANYALHGLAGNNSTLAAGTFAAITEEKINLEMQSLNIIKEPIVLAPASNEMVAENPMGDRVYNIGETLKRYYMAYSFNSNVAAPTGYLTFQLDPICFQANDTQFGDTIPSTVLYNRSVGMLSWFGAMYRSHFGSMRVRVQFNPDSALQNAFVTPLPNPLTPDYANYQPLIIRTPVGLMCNLLAAKTIPSQLGLVENVAGILPRTSVSSNYAQLSPAVTWADPAANYLNVEIPYYSRYKFLVQVHSTSLEGGTINSDVAVMAELTVIVPKVQTIQYNPVGPLNAGIQSGTTNIWISAGDEFRLGIYLGPPFLRLFAQNYGSDTYL